MNVNKVLGVFLKGCVWILVVVVSQTGCHSPQGNADSLKTQTKETNDDELPNREAERLPLKWEHLKVRSYKYLDDAIDLYFTDAEFGWAVGWWAGGPNAGETGSRTDIMRTTDGGKSWEETFPKQMFNAFQFINPRVGIGVGYEWRLENVPKASSGMSKADGVVLLTTDGGKSWFETYRVAGDNILSVCFTKDGSGGSLATSCFVTSHDNGEANAGRSGVKHS